MRAQYTIGTLAKQAGVTVEAIRFYQKRGLVQEPPKPLGGIRRYSEVHAQRIRFIRETQRLGFSLNEVDDLLALDDGRLCREAEQIGQRKLEAVRERIAQLGRIEKVLAKLVDRCRLNSGRVRCPLITSLEEA